MPKTFTKVKTYPKECYVQDEDLKFVIIVSRYNGKRVFVQHKSREERELPWWHREIWEGILEWAKRELFEETWALEYDIEHIGYWSLINWKRGESFWAVFFAEITKFGNKPESEIAKIDFFDTIPQNVTYPNVHPRIHKMGVTHTHKIKKTYKQCQSCGMPLKRDSQGGGSEKDGTISKRYCSSCYRDGLFTRPNISLQEMQKLVDTVLKNEMKWRKLFRWFAVRQIATLERWKKQ